MGQTQWPGKTMEFVSKFYVNTTLVCDIDGLNLPRVTFKYWILPNGTSLQYWHKNGTKFVVGEHPEYNLTIVDVNGYDFGYYYCFVFWDPRLFLASSVKIGLNSQGADTSGLLGKYQKSAFYGGIIAGATGVALSSVCLLYWCKYGEQNTVNKPMKDDANKSDVKSNDDVHTTETLVLRKCFRRSRASTTTASETETDEKRAVYELDKAVNAFDDGYSQPSDVIDFTSLTLRRRSSFDAVRVRRRGYFEFEECADVTPPLPPPPPIDDLISDATDDESSITDVVRRNTEKMIRVTDEELGRRTVKSVYDIPKNSNLWFENPTCETDVNDTHIKSNVEVVTLHKPELECNIANLHSELLESFKKREVSITDALRNIDPKFPRQDSGSGCSQKGTVVHAQTDAGHPGSEAGFQMNIGKQDHSSADDISPKAQATKGDKLQIADTRF